MGHNLEEVWPANVKMAEALRLYGDGEEPGESGFNIAFGLPKDKSFFDFIAEDGAGDKKGWRMRRFAQTMQSWSSGSSHGTHHIHRGFDWKSLGDATIVDVRKPLLLPRDFRSFILICGKN